MRINYVGELGHGVTAKDLILGTIGQMGTNGAAGHVVEYAGEVIEALSMEERMTICNMTIEGGGRAGMIAPDETTFEWVEGRPGAPEDFEEALDVLAHAEDRRGRDVRPRDHRRRVRRSRRWSPGAPTPGQVVGVAERRARAAAPRPTSARWSTWAWRPARRCTELKLDRVFIGSCTNARIGDLRAAAEMIKGRKVASHRRARWSSPAPSRCAKQAEREGLDEIFRAAGFDWRTAGCSMCLGMNPDILEPGERCASTSNRNFEGRQGRGGRTHLVSPQMAAAAAIEGHFVDIREWN